MRLNALTIGLVRKILFPENRRVIYDIIFGEHVIYSVTKALIYFNLRSSIKASAMCTRNVHLLF